MYHAVTFTLIVALGASTVFCHDSAKPITSWSVDDVERWMVHEIGYPEYGEVIKSHRIDGPTLMYLDPETAFEPSHPVHLAKIEAHLDLLRGQCLCPSPAGDLWSLIDAEPFRAATIGSGVAWAPRLTLLSVYFADKSTFNIIMGDDEENVSSSNQLLFLLALLFAPRLLVLYKLFAFAFWSNYVLVPIFAVHLAVEQFNDAFFIYGLIRPSALPQEKRNKPLWKRLVAPSMLIPVVVLPLSLLLPALFGKLLLLAFLLHSLFLSVGLVIKFFAGFSEGAAKQNQEHDRQ